MFPSFPRLPCLTGDFVFLFFFLSRSPPQSTLWRFSARRRSESEAPPPWEMEGRGKSMRRKHFPTSPTSPTSHSCVIWSFLCCSETLDTFWRTYFLSCFSATSRLDDAMDSNRKSKATYAQYPLAPLNSFRSRGGMAYFIKGICSPLHFGRKAVLSLGKKNPWHLSEKSRHYWIIIIRTTFKVRSKNLILIMKSFITTIIIITFAMMLDMSTGMYVPCTINQSIYLPTYLPKPRKKLHLG